MEYYVRCDYLEYNPKEEEEKIRVGREDSRPIFVHPDLLLSTFGQTLVRTKKVSCMDLIRRTVYIKSTRSSKLIKRTVELGDLVSEDEIEMLKVGRC